MGGHSIQFWYKPPFPAFPLHWRHSYPSAAEVPMWKDSWKRHIWAYWRGQFYIMIRPFRKRGQNQVHFHFHSTGRRPQDGSSLLKRVLTAQLISSSSGLNKPANLEKYSAMETDFRRVGHSTPSSSDTLQPPNVFLSDIFLGHLDFYWLFWGDCFLFRK